MAFIFKDLVIEVYKKTLKFVNNNKRYVKFASVAAALVVVLVVAAISSGLTFGFNVKYSGKNIAVVSSKSVFENAKDSIIQKLWNNGGDSIAVPRYTLTITLADNLTDVDALTDAIIENTDEVTTSSALMVNGEVIAYGDSEELQNMLDAVLCKYYVKGAENNSTFIDNVEVCEGYALTNEVKSAEELAEIVNALQVKTVSTVTTESEIEYTTKMVYSADYGRNYEKVETEGVNGVETKVEVVETLNGKETARTRVSGKVTKQPVQKVVIKGTASSYASATATAEAKSQGFIRPMNKGDIKLITAFWGDGRNHKAIDFAGDVGVPIFASKAGKVTFSGYDGNYGYAVVIDHGNGYQTRYAHASALCVKTGDTVSQGQQVAKLGNTGRSTGPHLHFEIIKNGSQVNPAHYIGY